MVLNAGDIPIINIFRDSVKGKKFVYGCRNGDLIQKNN